MQLTREIADFVLYLQVERGFSEHTVRAYRSDLARLQSFEMDGIWWLTNTI